MPNWPPEFMNQNPRTPSWLVGHSYWTTADELSFVQALAAKRDPQRLRSYLATARVRTWDKSVDGAQVILRTEDMLRDLLAELEADRLWAMAKANGKAEGKS